MSKTDIKEKIKESPLAEALTERYLSYALSTIVSRSLPDVRDGLKPVHRRLLYAMRQLKLDPKSGFKKCARVVGDVIGKFHPHGDAAVYDAMVRLAQDFAVRYPLVEGQGNFGNIDGDSAAAMRYTEARLTDVAWSLMEDIEQDCVDFRFTYDGEEREPVVMPSAFPNLLANGSAGIAVGMATNIPPHNVSELCDALLHLINKPEAEVKDLVSFVKGPDFPTGGILCSNEHEILNAYESGRGSFRIRSKWEKETLAHGLFQIIITEIPYQVQKARLIENLANLLIAKKLPLLADIRDESAENIRIVLEPKNRTVEPEYVMEHLFKHTELETRFSLNLNVLDANGVPGVMSLKQALVAFLEHRMVVLERRLAFRLDKITYRMEVLQGYLIAYLNLDEIIRIIREEDEPSEVMKDKFKLTDIQVEAILNMKLRSLRRLEEFEIKREYDELNAEKNNILELQENKDKRWIKISEEIKEIKEKFSKKTALGRRRTMLEEAAPSIEVPIEAMIEKEPITIILSEMGWIRSVKGHIDAVDEFKFKEGDNLKYVLQAQTTDKILFFASKGRFFTISGNDIPGGRGFGQPLRLMIDLSNDDEVIDMRVYNPEGKLLVVSKQGRGFIVEESNVIAQTRTGKMILNVAEQDEAKLCREAEGDTIAVIGENRRMLIFKTEEIPVMARGRGVILQKYRSGFISDAKIFNIDDGLSYPLGGGIHIEKDLLTWIGKRGLAGKLPPPGFPRNNSFFK
ncbi:MAG: DNA topoisomerase IV subunit A [Alphaproteobacteria bacterium]